MHEMKFPDKAGMHFVSVSDDGLEVHSELGESVIGELRAIRSLIATLTQWEIENTCQAVFRSVKEFGNVTLQCELKRGAHSNTEHRATVYQPNGCGSKKVVTWASFYGYTIQEES